MRTGFSPIQGRLTVAPASFAGSIASGSKTRQDFVAGSEDRKFVSTTDSAVVGSRPTAILVAG